MTTYALAHPFEDTESDLRSQWRTSLVFTVLIHCALLAAGAFSQRDSLLDLISHGETLAIAPSVPVFEQKVFEIDLTPPPPPEVNPDFIKPVEVKPKPPEVVVQKPIPKPLPPPAVAPPAAPAFAASGYAEGNKNFPKPPYPYEAKLKHFQGTVIISLTVVGGRIVNAEVHSSSGYGVLDNTAVSWVKHQWKFPESITQNLTLPVKFELTSAQS